MTPTTVSLLFFLAAVIIPITVFLCDLLALRKIKRQHRDELLEIKREMDEILEAARKKS